MTYKECLLFTAKCLTLTNSSKHLNAVKNLIKNESFDWDSIVKLSTEHYVFPALYCNLKKANLLSFLPDELIEYMKYITQLNRDRNLEIVKQVNEINDILTLRGIRPIFIKGAALLSQGIFDDIGERMIGDIDFLVSPKQAKQTFDILINNGYNKVHTNNYEFPDPKHLSRIIKEESIAAVEIHFEMTVGKYQKNFNYESVSKSIIKKNGIYFLSYKNQTRLAIIAKEINDDGRYFYDMTLRNGYDVLQLSYKINTLNILEDLEKLYHPLNNFLAGCNQFFNVETIKFNDTLKAKKHLQKFNFLLNDTQKRKSYSKRKNRSIFIKKRIDIILKSIIDKGYRVWIWNRIRDKKWIDEKLNYLGFKSKP